MDALAQTMKPSPNAEAQFAPRPQRLEETGLGREFVADLILKHLHDAGAANLAELAARICLPASIIEGVLEFLRREARVEVRAPSGMGGVRFLLTESGRASALDALARSGYIGPAPVPLAHYADIARCQSVRDCVVTRQAIRRWFSSMVVRDSLLDQLGPALHSGRAIFIYGPPGTGKSYVSRRLAGLLRGPVLVPHAVLAGGEVIELFDPVLHRLRDEAAAPELILGEGHDARFARCERPVAITGGELTLDALELRYDAATRRYIAPLQMQANNGLLMIDDLGRQRADTTDLLNRWIVPMESRLDFHNIRGRHFEVPFDLVLIFSTNLDPLELADEAFLRRIGYKIRFDFLDADEYRAIWRQECGKRGITDEGDVLEFVLGDLHGSRSVPLLPCHPRDLIELAADHARYNAAPPTLTRETIRWAWDNYFVRLN